MGDKKPLLASSVVWCLEVVGGGITPEGFQLPDYDSETPIDEK